jgi:UDP-hydrolysing UDP-N-acetyl-D-glucosamine 2-epimerase
MRKIAVVTVGRSDYGIYLPVLRQIERHPDLDLHLIVAGMHLMPAFGNTIDAIIADGFSIGDQIDLSLSSDSPEAVAKSMGLGTICYAQALARAKPDILLLLGDRFEMHAAAVAALPLRIPIAHIHGGELTLGAIDDALRHSMTKLSHLHFVTTQEYARRVEQMGEEPWRIVISGAPGLDNVRETERLELGEFSRRFGIQERDRFLLVTYHPATLDFGVLENRFKELLAALAESGHPILFTLSNADSGGQQINRMIREYVAEHSSAQLVENLGTAGYFSAMSLAAAMVGNSSSGIIEAASFRVPVVNVGTRQSGRIRAANVIDAGETRTLILSAIQQAVSPEFGEKLTHLQNPFGDGHASEKIVERLASQELGASLLVKKFRDLL